MNNKLLEEIYNQIENSVIEMSPDESLKFLFALDTKLYLLQGTESIRHGEGIHSKHRHINYHKFFEDNIEKGTSVLDIGCSVGELTNDIAGAADPGKVIGVEIEEYKVVEAKERYKKANLEFVHADATKDFVDGEFDIITLSNVLEHIEHRIDFLKVLSEKYNPNKFIIRVPSFERDWRVPLKKELGIDYRLDDTHFIEYTEETFLDETSRAGLTIKKMRGVWGEIWAILEPK